MTRKSTITSHTDSAGEYEVEVFGCQQPRAVVVCAHGNGVRRWDGERFYYAVAEHYPSRAFMLVDQCQILDDGCELNDIQIMAARVQSLVSLAAEQYPGVPVVVLAHSMGCGIATMLDLSAVARVVFVAPAAGDVYDALVERYGEDILEGKVVKTTDGLTKSIPKRYVESVEGFVWEDRYRELLIRYPEVYVFEAGEEEIVGEGRLQHRDLPFAGYWIVPGAHHNFTGEPLSQLYKDLGSLL